MCIIDQVSGVRDHVFPVYDQRLSICLGLSVFVLSPLEVLENNLTTSVESTYLPHLRRSTVSGAYINQGRRLHSFHII